VIVFIVDDSSLLLHYSHLFYTATVLTNVLFHESHDRVGIMRESLSRYIINVYFQIEVQALCASLSCSLRIILCWFCSNLSTKKL